LVSVIGIVADFENRKEREKFIQKNGDIIEEERQKKL
jgi:hypothetical protein